MADFTPARRSRAPLAKNQGVPPTIPASQHAPPAAANPPHPSAAVASSSKRPRGRPRGSRKNSKPPVHIAEDNSTTRRIQLVIPGGCNLVTTLENYARKHQIGIQVVGGFGTLGNVKLLNPEGFFTCFTYLLGLAGTFPSNIPGGDNVPWLTMFMSGSSWNIITQAALVAEALTVTDVVVTIITFKMHEIQVADPDVISKPQYQSGSPPTSPLTDSRIGGSGRTSGTELGGHARMGGVMPAPRFGIADRGQMHFVPVRTGVSYRLPKSEPE